ncbi:MAG: flagellar basal body P-ring formation chaperone FlgA [Pseudomonadota bacterium]
MIRLLPILLMLATPTFSETLVATRVVRPNSVISENDFAVAEKSVSGALASSERIAGLEARVTLYPGRPIMPEHVGPPAVVERNQPIKLIFRQGSLTISTDARALSRGGVGDVIRAMNLASRTTVSGVILPNGTIKVTSGGF